MDINNKKKFIIKTIQDWDYQYTPVNDEDIEPIYQLFKNDIVMNDNNITANVASNYAVYYKVKDNIPLMIKYSKIAIQKGDGDSCYNLAVYYQNNDDIYNFIKYVKKGIRRNHSLSILTFGIYNYDIKKYDIALIHLKKALRIEIKKHNNNDNNNDNNNYNNLNYEIKHLIIPYIVKIYENLNDTDNVIKYCKKGYKINDEFSIFMLAKIYLDKKDTKKMFKYANKLLALNYYHSGVAIFSNYYKSIRDFKNQLKYLKIGADNGDEESVIDLINYYLGLKNYKEPIQILLNFISKNEENIKNDIYSLLADIYKITEDFINMKKYYLLSYEKGSLVALDKLIDYYSLNGSIDESLEYCIKGMKKDKLFYSNIMNSIIEKQSFKEKYFIKYEKYLDKINKVKFNNFKAVFLTYENLFEDFYLKKEDCIICYEKLEHVELSCKHEICYKCYKEINKCPICRESKD